MLLKSLVITAALFSASFQETQADKCLTHGKPCQGKNECCRDTSECGKIEEGESKVCVPYITGTERDGKCRRYGEPCEWNENKSEHNCCLIEDAATFCDLEGKCIVTHYRWGYMDEERK